MNSCPGCKSPKSTPFGNKNGFTIKRCRDCGSIYTIEDVTWEYDDYYGGENPEIPEFVTRRAAEILAGFESYRQTNNLVDVGFGAGTLLDAANGWNKYGVEVARSAVDNAKPEWSTFYGTLEQAAYPSEFFDVVLASEIIEHCPDPRELIEEVHRILRPGGVFWATTPAANGLSSRLLGAKWSVVSPPEHVQLFSSKALRSMLNKFSRVRVQMHGFNPGELMQKTDNSGRERVESSYAMNQSFTSSPWRVRVKSLLNFGLSTLRLGDSLKIRAIK